MCALFSSCLCISISSSVHVSLSNSMHSSISNFVCICLLVPHSPSKSPSPGHHSQSSRLGSSSSGSDSGSGSASCSSSSESSESGSNDEGDAGSPAGSRAPSEGSGSSSSEHSCSTSLKVVSEVVLVQENDENAAADKEDEDPLDDEEAQSQGTVSLLNISSSDNEEAHKATVHEKACKSDVQFAAWQGEQICQGNKAIAWCDKQVHDYVDTGRTSKAPDKIGPLLTYMEECRVFKPLDTIANPMGLCIFYWMDLKKSNVTTGLKSVASTHKIHHLLVLAKELK